MPFRRMMSTSKAVNWNQRTDFFRFARGRFVCDEKTQMAQRYVRFNMNELCRVAGESIGRECVDVEKFADGMYNKAFLLTMDDGQQIVIKVPNPNAGMPQPTTASEVATMDFMRNKLDIPAPQVIAWNSSSDNPVEAEYIIMEKAKGVPLSSMWPTLDVGNKVQVIRSIVRYQRTWAQTSFNQIGSLYYRKDLDNTTQNYANTGIAEKDTVLRFVAGPILGRDWLDHGRSELQVDRGLWLSIAAFKKAEIERDLQAVRTAPSLPKSLSMLCGAAYCLGAVAALDDSPASNSVKRSWQRFSEASKPRTRVFGRWIRSSRRWATCFPRRGLSGMRSTMIARLRFGGSRGRW